MNLQNLERLPAWTGFDTENSLSNKQQAEDAKAIRSWPLFLEMLESETARRAQATRSREPARLEPVAI